MMVISKGVINGCATLIGARFLSHTHPQPKLRARLDWNFGNRHLNTLLLCYFLVEQPASLSLPEPQKSFPSREPVELTFPSISVAVKLPKIIDGSCACVRAARSTLDLLSENSRSFHLVQEMPNRYEGKGRASIYYLKPIYKNKTPHS